MTANELFDASLKLVESKSIRAWAQSNHNKPLWLEICATAVKNGRKDAAAMAAYMVALAIGL